MCLRVSIARVKRISHSGWSRTIAFVIWHKMLYADQTERNIAKRRLTQPSSIPFMHRVWPKYYNNIYPSRCRPYVCCCSSCWLMHPQCTTNADHPLKLPTYMACVLGMILQSKCHEIFAAPLEISRCRRLCRRIFFLPIGVVTLLQHLLLFATHLHILAALPPKCQQTCNSRFRQR